MFQANHLSVKHSSQIEHTKTDLHPSVSQSTLTKTSLCNHQHRSPKSKTPTVILSVLRPSMTYMSITVLRVEASKGPGRLGTLVNELHLHVIVNHFHTSYARTVQFFFFALLK